MARLRRILPIILMIWPYVFFVHEYFEYKNAHNFFTLYVILTIVVYVLNIVNALTYPKDKVNDLAFYDMLIKFVHIPFFLLILDRSAIAVCDGRSGTDLFQSLNDNDSGNHRLFADDNFFDVRHQRRCQIGTKRQA